MEAGRKVVMLTRTPVNPPNNDPPGETAARWGKLSSDCNPTDLERLQRLITLAEGVVTHQQNIVGDTEIAHAFSVMEILADIHAGCDTLLASLLYGLSQVHAIEPEQIRRDYGEDLLTLVQNIERMRILDVHQAQATAEQRDHQQLESIRKLLLALANDVRVVLIKLAERVYLLRHLKTLPTVLREQAAQETMDIYAPLANRLGVWQLKWELEDLSFRYLNPDTYKQIAGLLDERRVDRERYIQNVLEILQKEIERAGIKAWVSGRPKHIYSIWRKMNKKGLQFDQLYDVRATRVLVDKVADCYTVLGIVHTLWRPIRSEFDDYIAVPKDNDYQSLHTAVIGPDDKTLEVQIRTHDMHVHNEYGVASHWRYKEGGRHDKKFQEKITWLRRLLEWKDEAETDDGLFEEFKTELFEDRVYVLTPHGKVIDLPQGATPLDFAYAIHTEVGHRYRGAKVDGGIVPQGYPLQNGQQVEVLTGKHAKPSRDWLNPSLHYANSPRTRGKIRAWFRQQDFAQNRDAGREILDQERKRMGIADSVDLCRLPERFQQTDFDALYEAIGRGDVSVAQLAKALAPEALPRTDGQPGVIPLPRALRSRSSGWDRQAVQIMGVGDLLVNIARCCRPVPFDDVAGYITRGRGVSVHRTDCANLLRLQADEKERVIEVSWGHGRGQTYQVEIFIHAFDRQGLLADITTILTAERLNVIAVNTNTDKKTSIASMSLTVEVLDAEQLGRALTRIQHLTNVLNASRK